MNVKQLKKWLDQFDESYTVEVVSHETGGGSYDQGGWAKQVPIENADGIAFDLCSATNTLLLGEIDT